MNLLAELLSTSQSWTEKDLELLTVTPLLTSPVGLAPRKPTVPLKE